MLQTAWPESIWWFADIRAADASRSLLEDTAQPDLRGFLGTGFDAGLLRPGSCDVSPRGLVRAVVGVPHSYTAGFSGGFFIELYSSMLSV